MRNWYGGGFGLCVLFVLSLPLDNVAAQEPDLPELRQQIQIFSGILQEGLELNETPGFLGVNSGRVATVYLRHQGVVFEIRTPLANQRNRISLNALASSIRSLSGTTNPFEIMARQRSAGGPSANAELTQSDDLTDRSGPDAMESPSASDYQSTIDTAIRDAGRGARMLVEIEAIDDSALESLRQELDDLASQVRESLRQLRQFEDQESGNQLSADDGGLPQRIISPQQAGELQEALQQFAIQARQMAADLDERYQLARSEYQQQWRHKVGVFEDSLFGLLCDYGATLRELPESEHVTVVLVGLGADTDQALPANRIHVVTKRDLLACQSDDLDPQGLQQQAASYNY